MTQRFLITALVFLVFCHSALAQDNVIGTDQLRSGLVYGRGYVLAITAPSGWVLDNSSGTGQGLNAVFYPHGSSWEQSLSVMYVNVVPKKNGASQSLQQIVYTDLSELKTKSPKLIVTNADGLLTGAKHQAVVRYLSGTSGGNWEAVAYINEKKIVTEIVLSARNQAQFKASLPVFRQLVGSYHFLTNKVKIMKKRHGTV